MSGPERCLVIGSGRCGSTLLSDLIAGDPETLSIQESLMTLKDPGLWKSADKMTGSEYWSVLTRPTREWKTAFRVGAISAEARYPATGRWGGDLAALPLIALVTLPAISADPDSLFDLLEAHVPEFPAQLLAEHHCMFLDLLASLQQRGRWVERTGGSSVLAGPLLENLPLDKVVYLTREAGDAAASMSRHSSFQFAVIRAQFVFRCGFDPYSDLTSASALADGRSVPAEMQCLLPEHLTMATLAERGGQLESHKLLLVGMRYAAEVALARHPPRQLLRMRYEDLLAAPQRQLTGLAEFLGFAEPAAWAARSAGRVRRPARPGPGVARAVQPTGSRGR